MNPNTEPEPEKDEIARLNVAISENLIHLTNIGENDDEEEVQKTWAEIHRLVMLKSEMIVNLSAGIPKPPIYLAVKSDGTEEGTFLYDYHTGRKVEGVEWFFTGAESERPEIIGATLRVDLAALDITAPLFAWPEPRRHGPESQKARRVGVAKFTAKPDDYNNPAASSVAAMVCDEAGVQLSDIYGASFNFPANSHGTFVKEEYAAGPALMFHKTPLSER